MVGSSDSRQESVARPAGFGQLAVTFTRSTVDHLSVSDYRTALPFIKVMDCLYVIRVLPVFHTFVIKIYSFMLLLSAY